MNSKGITPVVAVVLLMTIAIAATTAAYEFIINTQTNAEKSFEDQFNQRELERRSDLNVETIYKGPDGYAFMSIRNTGSITQTIEDADGRYWNLYVDNKPVNDWTYVGGVSMPVQLNPGSTININTSEMFPSSGSEVKFEMIGRYSSSDTYFCKNTGGSSC